MATSPVVRQALMSYLHGQPSPRTVLVRAGSQTLTSAAAASRHLLLGKLTWRTDRSDHSHIVVQSADDISWPGAHSTGHGLVVVLAQTFPAVKFLHSAGTVTMYLPATGHYHDITDPQEVTPVLVLWSISPAQAGIAPIEAQSATQVIAHAQQHSSQHLQLITPLDSQTTSVSTPPASTEPWAVVRGRTLRLGYLSPTPSTAVGTGWLANGPSPGLSQGPNHEPSRSRSLSPLGRSTSPGPDHLAAVYTLPGPVGSGTPVIWGAPPLVNVSIPNQTYSQTLPLVSTSSGGTPTAWGEPHELHRQLMVSRDISPIIPSTVIVHRRSMDARTDTAPLPEWSAPSSNEASWYRPVDATPVPTSFAGSLVSGSATTFTPNFSAPLLPVITPVVTGWSTPTTTFFPGSSYERSHSAHEPPRDLSVQQVSDADLDNIERAVLSYALGTQDRTILIKTNYEDPRINEDYRTSKPAQYEQAVAQAAWTSFRSPGEEPPPRVYFPGGATTAEALLQLLRPTLRNQGVSVEVIAGELTLYRPRTQEARAVVDTVTFLNPRCFTRPGLGTAWSTTTCIWDAEVIGVYGTIPASATALDELSV